MASQSRVISFLIRVTFAIEMKTHSRDFCDWSGNPLLTRKRELVMAYFLVKNYFLADNIRKINFV